jgi:hypothetical protein
MACEAGPWGKVFREALEALSKGTGKAAREGAEEGVEQAAARHTLREGLETIAESGSRRIGGKAVREAGQSGGALALRHGDEIAGPIVAKFGDDGAHALNALSTTGAQRLATMADDLASSGRGRDWMRLVAQRGDEVTDWLWRRRGSVAVGTAATAIVLQPEEFLHAAEHVATSAIGAAGEHVAGPLVRNAAAGIPWGALWTIAIVVAVWWFLSRRLARLSGQMVHGAAESLSALGRLPRDTTTQTIGPDVVRDVEGREL